MKNNKPAMEFMLTYGWSILVVLVAIGCLVYFGVLAPENIIPDYHFRKNCSAMNGTLIFMEHNIDLFAEECDRSKLCDTGKYNLCVYPNAKIEFVDMFADILYNSTKT